MPGQEANEDDSEENGCLVVNQKEANREVGIGKIGGGQIDCRGLCRPPLECWRL